MRLKISFGLSAILLAMMVTPAVKAAVTTEDYVRAIALLPKNIGSHIHQMTLTPHWIGQGHKFWYEQETPEGKNFLLVDPETGEKKSLFDRARVMMSLASFAEEMDDRPEVSVLKVADDLSHMDIRWKERQFEVDLTTYVTTEKTPAPEQAAVSPDGRWQVVRQGANIALKDIRTGQVRALTSDGAPDHAYAQPLISPKEMIEQQSNHPTLPPEVFWSSDSTKFIIYRIDQRTVGELTLTQSVPPAGLRARTFTYKYSLTGDIDVPTATAIIYDIATSEMTPVAMPPLNVMYYGGPWFQWLKGDEALIFLRPERGYKAMDLVRIDAQTGATQVVIRETAEDFVDYYGHQMEVISEGREILWMSSQSGFGHMQRYDLMTGRKLNSLTQGNWRFRYLEKEVGDDLYFLGSGREKGRNPYLYHFYRVKKDGSGLTLLTPEAVNHGIQLSPDGKYFIDAQSLLDHPTEFLLRESRDGKVVMTLEKTDVSGLTERHVNWPEPFEALAADGKTPIYGAIYRPSHFDPTKSYPVIDNIYMGPHYVMTKQSFDRGIRTSALAMAEMGFIVIQVDGRGSHKRGHKFLAHAYQNLGENGIDDHIAAIRQLAGRYRYMDVERVGIFGFSAGGYDTARAMFTRPDFYKVGVAASGNHDMRSDKAVWNEQWMGLPMGPHYDRDSNLTMAKDLRGKLLLAHGDLDDNVNPMASLQLVDALIEANKDFDFLMMPGWGHFLNESEYFQRRRWDYFLRHLKGENPVPLNP